MALSFANIVGGLQTGFTTPGYTVSADKAPELNATQVAVTALTGTQAGVSAHNGASPFTVTAFKPKVFRVLGRPNPTTGLISNVPMNVYKVKTRKGMQPAANQPFHISTITTIIEVPAGCESYAAPEIRGMTSAHVGFLSANSAGLGDTVVSGIL